MKIDLRTFNDFFSVLRPRFVRFAAGYLHDEAIAEDLFVESMVAFWQVRESLPESTDVSCYILRILRNKCIDALRHRKVHEEYSDERKKLHEWDLSTRITSLEKFVPEEVMTAEIEQIVKDTVNSLSEETRKVFLLSRYEGKSNKEVAQEMGISEKGVEYHITKVNRILRTALKDYLTASVIIFYMLN